jgi:bis(5'-nucleosidyl)-tetraphosphatase
MSMKATKQSAGIVILRQFEDGPRYLLLRCYGYWDFPKGEVESGEDPLASARREVLEETGLSDLRFCWGEGFVETSPYGRGKVARYYLAESPSGKVHLPVSPELGMPEHQEFRWVRLDEALSLVNGRIRAVLEWAEKRLRV